MNRVSCEEVQEGAPEFFDFWSAFAIKSFGGGFMKLITILSIFMCAGAFAKKEHRHHEAHEHGAAKVQIAFDQKKGQMEFAGAAMAIVGFETQAKTSKQKAKVEEAYKKFDSNVAKMFGFATDLNCKFSKSKMSFEKEKSEAGGKKQHGEHADFKAVYSIECDRSPVGSKVTLDFSIFPELHDVDVDFLVDSIAKSIEFKGTPVQIDLIK